MGFLEGKRALIVGVASNKSIAWGIAQAMRREGAEIAMTYQNERLQGRVEKMAAELDSDLTFQCNVDTDEEINTAFSELAKHWGHLDILVHSMLLAIPQTDEKPELSALSIWSFSSKSMGLLVLSTMSESLW